MAKLNTAIRGAQIAIGVAGDGLGWDASENLKINVDDSTIEISTDSLRLKDLGVATGKIANDAVDKTKINADIAGSFISQAVGGELDVDVKDEDNMVSDSATHLATQQSIKAYVDSKSDEHDTFLELTDTPGAFGSAGQALRVNIGTDALEFYTPSDVDEKTKSDATDPASGYLDAKVDDSSIEVDTTAHKIRVKALGITNAMLAGSIAYSKLSLTGEILNADLAGSIAYSKLILTGAILNADLAGSIADDKLVEDYVKENQIQKANFAGDDATVLFDVGDTPITNSVQVFLMGLLQEEGSGKDYTLATDKITFSTAPLSGDIIQIHSIKA